MNWYQSKLCSENDNLNFRFFFSSFDRAVSAALTYSVPCLRLWSVATSESACTTFIIIATNCKQETAVKVMTLKSTRLGCM